MTLLTGTLLAHGRRTVCSALRMSGEQRHAYCLGIVRLGPAGVQSYQATQIGPRCVVFYFHDATSWLDRLLILPAVYRSCTFPRKATMWGFRGGHEVGG